MRDAWVCRTFLNADADCAVEGLKAHRRTSLLPPLPSFLTAVSLTSVFLVVQEFRKALGDPPEVAIQLGSDFLGDKKRGLFMSSGLT